jgi:hypothetical protein
MSLGCDAVLVLTSSGNDGVAVSEIASDWEADACCREGAIAGRTSTADPLAAGGREGPDSVELSAPGAGCAGEATAGLVVLAAGRSAGLVTVPCKLKFCSCDGPTVSAEGAGAAVTSTGLSLL